MKKPIFLVPIQYPTATKNGAMRKLINLIIKTHEGLKKNRRRTQFYVLASFIIATIGIRIITHLQKADILPNQHWALHIHHMVPGIFLILLAGYIGISFWNIERLRFLMAVLFGVGAALTIDEFALWLFLDDVYWEQEGKISIQALLATGALLTIVFLISEAHDHLRKLFYKDN